MADFTLTTPAEQPDSSFLGRGWSFPPAFGPAIGPFSRKLTLVEGAVDIEQSLRILFNTEPGERLMNPAYGCALRQFLFEQLDNSVLTRIKATVSNAVLLFEPRVRLLRVDVQADNVNDGVLLLEVSYEVRTVNSRHNVVFPFQREATLLGSTPT